METVGAIRKDGGLMWRKWKTKTTENSTPHPAKGAKNVLIVDDDPIIRELVREILALEDIKTEGLGSGTELREKFQIQQQEPDVLILDLSLPDDMGEHLLDLARKHWKNTCFILCTGHLYEKLDEYFAGRAAAILRKPFDADELLALFDK